MTMRVLQHLVCLFCFFTSSYLEFGIFFCNLKKLEFFKHRLDYIYWESTYFISAYLTLFPHHKIRALTHKRKLLSLNSFVLDF
ncbi:hypothetical protein HanRHA438_Chr07g0294801 [Helianthus annuus]|uniref:Uncharacterized protein n=1 Tax=Helianthus annuus TaxID=4232 RepID=A0A9K3IIX8_HELAN|nr:hypothetical protein HanXRQr2_Chr07g0284311 [Helianthus annuus]KAJ0549433.1 hypothetical protein HanHA300_Chr07g0233631 [Helianthus annuus]KAJ0555801.1 hypothetical protein HanIR_Chr07g0306321 [Helianthus annuus]KAJ0562388.1 hypothetical protein HanHA89_Chr07g0250801 [Helianthus annuus]KAJ0727763.1 hypothetical protein HanLR1_Chr07g0233561 [Helianthus annuus]